MCVAPLLAGTSSIFTFLRYIDSLYFIPIFSVVVIGMLTRKVPPFAANLALVGGCVFMVIGLICRFPIQQFHYAGIVFAALIAIMLIIGMLKPLIQPRTVPDANLIDLKPWKPAPYAAAVLFLIVLLMYILIEIY